ncbi:MAG: HD domain-containing protein [Oscillospiraceae bacterium]|nr:HD domain-containing protein [Oscillospiraceae bacterium]
MSQKIKSIIEALDRSIFVGERFEKNMHNIKITSLIVIVLGLVMFVLNFLQKQYITAASPLIILISGVISVLAVEKHRNREAAVVSTMVAIVLVLTFDILYVDNGFAFLWTLMVPLTVCYMFSVKLGIGISLYFEAIFVLLFYTPLRKLVEGHYSEVVMQRFPLLFFFVSLLTLYVMYQYHVSVLFEIDYAERLSEEVERQTKVATDRTEQLERQSQAMVETFARVIDAKDRYTNGHSFRVMHVAVQLSKKLGWGAEEIEQLKREALLHDIGKVGVPDAVLNKPARLTEMEYEVIKSHTTTGAAILSGLEDMSDIANVALSHHERYDGRGYPFGLAGSSISVHARVVAIADAYDAMSSSRPYREALSRELIRNELVNGRGTQFDPQFLDVFLDMFDAGELD